MGKYGAAAVIAAELLATRNGRDPGDAWRRAAGLVFEGQPPSRDKGCPQNAFLGLCEAGAVQGVAGGDYTRSVKNKAYVLRALEALRKRRWLAAVPRELWRIATDGADKQHNGQMDVLTALWERGWIVEREEAPPESDGTVDHAWFERGLPGIRDALDAFSSAVTEGRDLDALEERLTDVYAALNFMWNGYAEPELRAAEVPVLLPELYNALVDWPWRSFGPESFEPVDGRARDP